MEEDLLQLARSWLAEGRKVAIATVVSTWGSSPRPAGSQLITDDQGRMQGSVSGGCIEGAVIREARECMDGAPPRLLSFGVSNEQAWEVGLACGGRVEVYVEAAPSEAWLEAIDAARKAKRRAAHLRFLESHEQALVVEGEVVLGEAGEDGLQEVENALRQDRSRNVELGLGRAFVQIFNPPLRLAIIGAVHISQALVAMARLAGYEVTVIDPRGAFATRERFPGTHLDDEWPDEAMQRFDPDRRSAVVALTHDPKLDDPALDVALRSQAFYIAALGSRRTHAGRLERLAGMGHAEAALARIHGPAGLDIGAVSPAEIAVSVMAEMTGELRRKKD